MDKLVLKEPFSNHGRIRAKYLNYDLSNEKIELLINEGVWSEDIAEINYYNGPKINTFHSSEKRSVNKLTIPITTLPKGRDYDWIYGLSKRSLNEGIGQSPREIAFYFAGKLYYEPHNITDTDKEIIYDENGKLVEAIEWEYLQIKYRREDINDREKQIIIKLYGKKKRQSIQTLDNYLKQSGSSLKKLSKNNLNQAVEILYKVLHFKERRINVMGKHPIFIDLDGYLHIFLRHVEEFKVDQNFRHKDKFLWKEEDVFNVMGHVIEQADKEYQQFREEKPEKRFSKFGSQSLYFLGDYYTFHIESNGRLSTFHRNKKEHEKTKDNL